MTVPAPLRDAVRAISRGCGYAILDLRKSQATSLFLPGHLKEAFQNSGINCVIDVGAHRGAYGSMLRRMGYQGRIIAVEPLQDVYAELCNRASGDSNWRPLNIALGQREEIRPLNIYAARDLSSFLASVPHIEDIVPQAQVVSVANVAVHTIDRMFAEFVEGIADPRVFIKLDTQGYDLEVMGGALASLERIHGVQSEISVIPLYREMPTYVQSLAFFYSLGFTPTGFFTVTGHRQTGRTLEFDVVLTREHNACLRQGS